MIYEIRTYTLRPGTVAEVEQRWAEAYPAREQYSRLAGFFRTEIGPLNEVIHIWPYADLAERARIRAEAARDPAWPPKTAEFIVNQKVEILAPFPFAPQWTPGADGPVYEMRQYTFRAGTLPDIMASWEAALPARLEFSSPVLLGNLEFGPSANSFIHMWAYGSLEERNTVRRQATATGKWPPAGGRDRYLTQSNKILLPAPFSPAQ
jgi:hypothetical protein